MSVLTFFGRGSAFTDEQNSAYFWHGNDLVIIDCPTVAFQKAKKVMADKKAENIYILITHTHGDHSGAVGTMLSYVWFVLNKKATIIAPSGEVMEDLLTYLLRMEGCEPEWFRIMTADDLHAEWLVSAVPTSHVRTLDGKCFGYHLYIDGHDTIYTGDTATLEPYIPLLHDGAYLYSEISFHKSDAHLYMETVLPVLLNLAGKGIKVYLMHLDNEEEIMRRIQGTPLRIAPLYQNK